MKGFYSKMTIHPRRAAAQAGTKSLPAASTSSSAPRARGARKASKIKPAAFYATSLIKRKPRATKAEMEERAAFLIDYAHQHGPVSVRGLYYQAEVASVPGIDKSDQAYQRVQQQVLVLRRTGRMPYTDISDATRWMRKPTSYNSIQDALEENARTYREACGATQVSTSKCGAKRMRSQASSILLRASMTCR